MKLMLEVNFKINVYCILEEVPGDRFARIDHKDLILNSIYFPENPSPVRERVSPKKSVPRAEFQTVDIFLQETRICKDDIAFFLSLKFTPSPHSPIHNDNGHLPLCFNFFSLLSR
jgi:hypothetical protein